MNHLDCRLLYQKDTGTQLTTIENIVSYVENDPEIVEYVEWLETKVEELSNAKN